MESNAYTIIDKELKATIFYKDGDEWKSCGGGAVLPHKIHINSCYDDPRFTTTFIIDDLGFDIDFVMSHPFTEEWPLLKVELKGTVISEDGYVLGVFTATYNDCEVLSYDGVSMSLKSLSDENIANID